MQAAEQAEKRLEEYKQTRPEQLMLFYGSSGKLQQYSRTIELYDAIPKYFWGRAERENGKYLPSLKRQFKHRNAEYKVIVAPARIVDKNDNERDYFPGKREELVEDALRKLACDEKRGVFLDNEAGVLFSLYELQQELQRMGHTYSIDQLKDAILICNKTNIEVSSTDGKTIVGSPLFQTVGLQTKEDWTTHGKKVKAFVRFNPLVTTSIQSKTFRPINYEKCMSYKSVLARWFHKRLSHNYTQASFTNKYTILLSTIIRDSGVKQYASLRQNLQKVKQALDEMITAEVLKSYKIEKIRGERKNKIVDAKFVLTPHLSFINEMKLSNQMSKRLHGGGNKQQSLPWKPERRGE
jgi:hypothetical protein